MIPATKRNVADALESVESATVAEEITAYFARSAEDDERLVADVHRLQHRILTLRVALVVSGALTSGLVVGIAVHVLWGHGVLAGWLR